MYAVFFQFDETDRRGSKIVVDISTANQFIKEKVNESIDSHSFFIYELPRGPEDYQAAQTLDSARRFFNGDVINLLSHGVVRSLVYKILDGYFEEEAELEL